ncbi:MAG: hypothetical protein DIU71_04180 [Proteobacteria bacterium]|nr:MAG: hypothetical protein DIU71_04180 [Pseudomonadota bacterium]
MQQRRSMYSGSDAQNDCGAESTVLIVARSAHAHQRLATVLDRAFPDGSVRLVTAPLPTRPTTAAPVSARRGGVGRADRARHFDDGLVALSAREREVLCLIAKGMHIVEVARLLAIRPSTVCSHIKNIYRKRNVSSRAEAALEAKRLGLC